MSVRIIIGDALTALRKLPDESMHCCVTSPPYWGLRDYGTARWEGGADGCAHQPPDDWVEKQFNAHSNLRSVSGQSAAAQKRWFLPDGSCRCGAMRIDRQLGMEASLGEHVANMVEVFREVRRVLRSDGTLWLNYGDCYATSPNGRSAANTKATGNDDRTFRDKPFSTVGRIYDPAGGAKGGGFRGDNMGRTKCDSGAVPKGCVVAGGYLKPKDLCGIPWRVAFALQQDGWWLRSDIIWSKPNPMPESITDRPTKAHEYLFLLSKSERYYYDAEAIKEPLAALDFRPGIAGAYMEGALYNRSRASDTRGRLNQFSSPDGRNKRSVWTVATAPYSEAHFATFPPALIEPCILAGCSERCCSICGAPWARMAERESIALRPNSDSIRGHSPSAHRNGNPQRGAVAARVSTLGFEPSCGCDASGPIAGTILDPFGGAGTTGLVADRHGRNAILIELNPIYAAMAQRRIENDAGLFADVAVPASPPMDAA